MKKLFCVLLALVFMLGCAMAESIDLTSMSFEELRELQQRINEELVTRPEWKEVAVPSGNWVVGEDIPAGSYSVHPGPGGGYLTVRRDGHLIAGQGIRKESDAFGRLDLQDGDVVEIERGNLVFAPPIKLGF